MRTGVLLVGMLAMLALAVFVAVRVWTSVGDVPIGPWGLVAMGLGITFTLGLGVGLMRLAYLSERRDREE